MANPQPDNTLNQNIRAQNLKNLWQSPKAKFSIIAIGVATAIGLTYAISNLGGPSATPNLAPGQKDTSGPNVDAGGVSVTGSTEVTSEDERRARALAQANAAAEAKANGTPMIGDPINIKQEQANASGASDLGAVKNGEAMTGNMTPDQLRARASAVNAEIANRGNSTVTTTVNNTPPGTAQRATANGQQQPVPPVMYRFVNGDGSETLLTQQEYDKYMQSLGQTNQQTSEKTRMQIEALKKLSKGERANQYTSVTFSTPDYSKKSNASANGGNGNDASGKNAKDMGRRLVMGGEGFYGVLRTGVNTDDGGKDIVIEIVSGRLKGAKLMGVVNKGKSDIAFTLNTMAIPGAGMFPIKAMTVRETDMERGMADDVDHHWWRKYGSIFAAGLLTGFGNAAALNATTGSTVSVSNGSNSTIATKTEPLSNSDIAMIALGGAGAAIGKDLAADAATVEPTFYSRAKKGLGVYFLTDVYEGQNMALNATTENERPAPIAQRPMPQMPQMPQPQPVIIQQPQRQQNYQTGMPVSRPMYESTW